MNDEALLAALLPRVRQQLADREPAHDWLHVQRVTQTATLLARIEGADVGIVHLAALLHEWINLPKSHPDSSRSGELCADAVALLLRELGADEVRAQSVAECIRTHSFSRGLAPTSLEAQVLQDADRLDAIGAIGVARCFATCSSMGRPFYADEDPFCRERTPDDKQWGIDHFYRKLLKLGDTMNTRTARDMALSRIAFVQLFLNTLERELDPHPAPWTMLVKS